MGAPDFCIPIFQIHPCCGDIAPFGTTGNHRNQTVSFIQTDCRNLILQVLGYDSPPVMISFKFLIIGIVKIDVPAFRIIA